MDDEAVAQNLADRYRRFARIEAASRAPRYVEWALEMAADDEVLRLLAPLPSLKQQANLVFASIRWVLLNPGAPVPPYAELRPRMLAQWSEITRCILERSTQTNEPRRMATLLPFIAEVVGDRTVALVELGASMGLCLQPEQWCFDIGGARIGNINAPVLTIEVADGIALPSTLPRVVARAGIDLHPLDAASDEDVRWLEALIWPVGTGGELDSERIDSLHDAVQIARARPVDVIEGDLTSDSARLLAAMRERAEVLVVFHTAVFAYIELPARQRIARELMDLVAESSSTDHPVHWISNEGAGLTPYVDEIEPTERGDFSVAVDGRQRAFAHPHGVWLKPLPQQHS